MKWQMGWYAIASENNPSVTPYGRATSPFVLRKNGEDQEVTWQTRSSPFSRSAKGEVAFA